MKESHENKKSIKVALLGAGTVGLQVARLILEKSEELSVRIGRPLELVGVAVRDRKKPRPGIPDVFLTENAAALVARGDLDVVIELIGGIKEAGELVLAAIQHGASVVTANKALLAARAGEIFSAAENAGVDLYYEAAVAGAIPIMRPLRESLIGDSILVVMGIVNGTSNYILDKMSTEGTDYGTALREAQNLGYAEADPSADVEGRDAAAKAVLLASLAFHTHIDPDSVHFEGISWIEQDDIRAAKDFDCSVKLLAVAKIIDDGRVSVRVYPAMVPFSHPLASVRGAYNAIFIEAEAAGRLMFLGPGAGGNPTASAVAGDLVTVAQNRARGVSGPKQVFSDDRREAPPEAVMTRCFFRMSVVDEPGVLANLAGVLAKHNISVQTAQQAPGKGEKEHELKSAELRLMTHLASEAAVMACVEELQANKRVLDKIRLLRVEGL